MTDWPDEPWCEEDSRWFARHRSRRYRIRLAGLDENRTLCEQAGEPYQPWDVTGPNGEPTEEYVLVQQLCAGIRQRHLFLLCNIPNAPAEMLWPDDATIIEFMHFIGHGAMLEPIRPIR